MPELFVTLSGACLCSAVRFSYSGLIGGALGQVTACHCSQCRRAQGYAAAAAPISTEGFSILNGEGHVLQYESSPGKWRAFCSLCGSPLYSRRDDAPTTLRIRLGALDSLPDVLRIEAHIFTENAPAWSLPAQAPSYPAKEPGR